MDSPPLLTDISLSIDPEFGYLTFEDLLVSGWLKKYFYTIIIFFILNLANISNNMRLGVSSMESFIFEDTSILLNGISLIALDAVGLLLSLGLFVQFQAIRLRSLGKQDSCIGIFTLFIIVQGCAGVLSILSAVLGTSVSIFFAIYTAVVPLALGLGFRFVARVIENIMSIKSE